MTADKKTNQTGTAPEAQALEQGREPAPEMLIGAHHVDRRTEYIQKADKAEPEFSHSWADNPSAQRLSMLEASTVEASVVFGGTSKKPIVGGRSDIMIRRRREVATSEKVASELESKRKVDRAYAGKANEDRKKFSTSSIKRQPRSAEDLLKRRN